MLQSPGMLSVSAEGPAWQEALLTDRFGSICCLPCRLKVVFLFLCFFPRLPCASCRGGGSLRSSLDRSWRCEAPFFASWKFRSLLLPVVRGALFCCSFRRLRRGVAFCRRRRTAVLQSAGDSAHGLRGADLFEEKAWMLSFFLACPSFLEAQ